MTHEELMNHYPEFACHFPIIEVARYMLQVNWKWVDYPKCKVPDKVTVANHIRYMFEQPRVHGETHPVWRECGGFKLHETRDIEKGHQLTLMFHEKGCASKILFSHSINLEPLTLKENENAEFES